MGNTCIPMADSGECYGKKTPQYCKVISLQLKKKRKVEAEGQSIRALQGEGTTCEQP